MLKTSSHGLVAKSMDSHPGNDDDNDDTCLMAIFQDNQVSRHQNSAFY